MTAKPRMTIYRGLPGSGKTTAANKLGCLVLSPLGMFAMEGGIYAYSERMHWENRKRARDVFLHILRSSLACGFDVAVAEVLPT